MASERAKNGWGRTRNVVPMVAQVETEPVNERADERARVIARIRKAAATAMPQQTLDWIQGFQAGVDAVLDAANADDQI